MINSTSGNQSPYTQLRSKNELTPTKHSKTVENSPGKSGLRSHSPQKNSPKSVISKKLLKIIVLKCILVALTN